MKLAPPPCGVYLSLRIDFDSDRLVQRIDTDSQTLNSAEEKAFDVIYEGCFTGHMTTASGRVGGVLRKGSPATLEACRSAANGGGLESISWDSGRALADLGIEPGAALCFITDQNRVALAKINSMTKVNGSIPAVDFTVTSWH
ncbi:hypothetical protein [Kitasatospora sp. NPDC059599]|uniref:hypothetical protein n=1 Tax=Kitasatospora sp. NPDC059599 TaxID=3346880 RepID=UPI0036CB4C69